jgi:hypothetical protein
MVARTSSKVQASFEASCFLHSPAVLEETHVIEGTDLSVSEEILRRFHDQGITSRTENLESVLLQTFRQIKDESSVSEQRRPLVTVS